MDCYLFVCHPWIGWWRHRTIFLDYENEVQPDAFLRLEPQHGGNSHINEDGYIRGAPELIVEIAASSTAYDLHDKRRVYARNGVQEYIAFQVYEEVVAWFVLREGVYQTLQPDETRILKSELFPGLWLNSVAFWEGDLAGVLATLQQGLLDEKHTALKTKLMERISK